MLQRRSVPSLLTEPSTDLDRVLSFSLATALDSQREEPWRIGTICDMIYRRPKSCDWPPERKRPETIRPGEWTLLIISETGIAEEFLHSTGRLVYTILRYAFVSIDESNSNIIVIDIEEFLRRTFSRPEDNEVLKVLLERWKERLEKVDEQIPGRDVSVGGQAEVESWLRSSDFHPSIPVPSGSEYHKQMLRTRKSVAC
jgi:hypothetical protein